MHLISSLSVTISHALISVSIVVEVIVITHHPSPITHHPSSITHHPSPPPSSSTPCQSCYTLFIRSACTLLSLRTAYPFLLWFIDYIPLACSHFLLFISSITYQYWKLNIIRIRMFGGEEWVFVIINLTFIWLMTIAYIIMLTIWITTFWLQSFTTNIVAFHLLCSILVFLSYNCFCHIDLIYKINYFEYFSSRIAFTTIF